MNSTASQQIFEDIKQAAIRLWQECDDTYGYASEKIRRVELVQNISPETKDVDIYGWQEIIAMFDPVNQRKLVLYLDTEEAKGFVEDYLFELRRAYFG